jgi:tetratricopeptide (TPR) repeat protein
MSYAVQSNPKRVLPPDRKHAGRANLIRFLLLAVIVVVFGRIVFNDFVDWDDGRLIYFNQNIASPTIHGLLNQWNWNDPGTNAMYNPLVYSLWWVLGHFAQLEYADMLHAKLNPQVFHLANLIVHWLTVCLVFEILRKIGLRDWPAAFGAAVFAVHPLQTEPIAWATGMKDLLCGLFTMAAIWRYLAALQATEARGRRNNYLAATALFLAALLAKPSSVVLPLVVAAMDRMLYRRRWRDIARWVAPWLVMSIPITLLASHIQTMPAVYRTSLWSRPFVALDALAFYAYKLVLPLYLSFDYGRTPNALLSQKTFLHPLYWTWIIPVAIALVLWRLRKRELTLGALIFVLSVLPVLGLTPFTFQYYSTVADRFVYGGMLGVALAVGWLVSQTKSRVVWSCAIAVLAAWCTQSFLQGGVWEDTDALYEHAAASATRGSAVHYAIYGQYKDMVAHAAWRKALLAKNQGNMAEYAEQIAIANKNFAEAIDGYETSMSIEPRDGVIYDQLGAALASAGRWDEAIKIQKERIANQVNLNQAFREDPAVLYDSLGMLNLQAKHYDAAVEAFEKSLTYKPDPDVEARLKKAREKVDLSPSTRPATIPAS